MRRIGLLFLVRIVVEILHNNPATSEIFRDGQYHLTGEGKVLSPDEMAGHYGENPVSKAVRQGFLSLEGGTISASSMTLYAANAIAPVIDAEGITPAAISGTATLA